jgi:hypothetical protein
MSTSCRGIDPRGHLDYPGRLHHRSRVYVGRTERFPCLPRYSAAALGPGDPDIELAYKFEADAARVGLRLQARSGRSVPGGVAADCVSARLERRAHESVTPEGSRPPLKQASLSSIRLPHANSRACSRRNSPADRGVIPRSRSGASSQVASTVS